MAGVPPIRIRELNRNPVRTDARFVLYWMTACRRPKWNYGLQRAAEWAQRLTQPLLVLEALRCDYPWASDRLHAFILQGMRQNSAHFERVPASYYPYVETSKGAGKGLIEALSCDASVVVADDYPAFFLPRMLTAAALKVSVLMEAVDSNGLLPMRAASQAFPTAFAFRRFLQKELPIHLRELPREDPLTGLELPLSGSPLKDVLEKWAPASPGMLDAGPDFLRSLPLDHRVTPVLTQGGWQTAVDTWRTFLRSRLSTYPLDRNHPDEHATSGLSPYLHFGHLSAHQVFSELTEAEEWLIEKTSRSSTGKRSGWWGMSEGAEAFLDQLITWRELGFNMCTFRGDYDRYDSLPQWARDDLQLHASDPRSSLYSLEQFEAAETHDTLWNAAQRQLIEEGTIHNYLRMLWGKKILEWSASPREALAIMIELNNKYALDGRDPNSYSGIFWILGRYDRPWGPIRPVFGKIRYMSSANTLRKLKVLEYLALFG
jgi:deoxyribodipyrimidine photo-lyase